MTRRDGLSPRQFALGHVGVSVIGAGGAWLANLIHPILGLIAGLTVILFWAYLCLLRLRDMGRPGWLQAPATGVLLICWALVAASTAGWIAQPVFSGPIADMAMLIVAFLLLGFYLTLMTTPSQPSSVDGSSA